MEEVINCVNAQSSPEELAIRFLLRYAGCRRALISNGDEGAQPAPDVPVLASRGKDQGEPVALTSVASVEVTPVPVRATVSDESCTARFSRAYAAARHLLAPTNGRRPASRKLA